MQALEEDLLLMAAKVEAMVSASIDALSDRNLKLAEEAIVLEPEIDRLEMRLDKRCITILARFKPVASDLRLVTAALKAVIYLERIADLAEHIGRGILELGTTRFPAVEQQLIHVGRIVNAMVRDVLDAFVNRDAALAADVVRRDRQADIAYAQCYPQVMTAMMQRPDRLEQLIVLQSIAASFERIGDHATNIGEIVAFLIDGRNGRALRDRGSSSGLFVVASPKS